MPSDPTRDELLAQVHDLKTRLAQRDAFTPPVRRHAVPHDTQAEHTIITETPRQTTLETKRVPPTSTTQFKTPAARAATPRSVNGATPEEILAQILSLKSVIVSGVESAGYGDKRTEFRSLAELRQILSDLEEQLEEMLGIGTGRIRQIRMTTSWDKGL